ncbi:hypothetical protein DV965_15855, partial [Staphylococcus pseudintermedius]|uniref:hypothetical protein n=1 Tax=Staphylococcus pseudintermedius TaxID=283734 RepID=UPI000E3874DE
MQQTLIHLLGIDLKKYLVFGKEMLSKDHKEIVPFRNGDCVTRKYKYVNDKAYSHRDNQTLET